MAKLFYTNIDLKGNQLLNGVIHNATEAPGNPVDGQVYYNTESKLMYQYNGDSKKWVVVGGSVTNLAIDVTKVVTGSTTSNGTATLQTTALKDMKVGVGLQNLTGVGETTTLSEEFQAIDTALQEVKTTYVKAGSTYTNGQLLVAGVNGAIETANTAGFSINNSSFNQSSNTDIPTSKQIANYIGSLAGGITYIGTVDGTNKLPETGVKVGDAYMVAADGEYADQNCNVGDLIICKSINGTTPEWSVVPINFTVEDKKLRNFAPQDGIQTIAVVDGQHITMSLQAITIGTSETGNVITNVSTDANNKLTLTKGNALTTVSPTTAVEGVVTSVVKNSNNTTIDVTYTSLAVDAPTGIQYVTSVSQAANGKVTVSGTNFDGTVPTDNPSTSNAPTTKAVKDYVDGKIDTLDVNNISGFGAGKTLATLTETDGKIAATFQDINITHDKVTDWDSNVGVTAVAEGTENGKISVTTNGTTAQVSVHGLGTAAYKAESYFEKAFTDGSHDVVKITDGASGDAYAKKVEFFDGKQTDGALETATTASGTLYISKAVSTTNPIITKDDLSGITGAMVYKGAINANTGLPTSGVQAGWTYVVATKGTYAGEECEVGDMIIAKDSTPTWNIINGENQVEDNGATLTAGGGATNIAVVDGTTITAQVNVTAGNATIATVTSNGDVTIKAGVTQTEKTGTITNITGSDITLKKLATSGAATDMTVASANYGGDTATTNAQTALNNLASAITAANITIDGFKGAIKTGNGLTHVTANNGSFGIKIDSTNNNGLSVGENGLAMAKATGSTFGTVNVTTGNGLTLTNGVVAYAHNTDEITVASKSGNIITINSILTPDASDNITTSDTDKINLAAVAATGAANELTVTSGTYGGSTYTTNAQTALDNLASSAVYVHKQDLSFNDGETATIEILDADLLESAITEIRDNTNNVVECDVTYNSETKITVGINGSLPTGTSLYAIVHYKKKA